MNRLVLLLSLLTFAVASCDKQIEVDSIIYNAVVYTVDDNFEKATAFAVKDRRFVEVGDKEVIMNKYTAKNMYDAGGRAIYPGFNDGHSHFTGYGLSVISSADLVGTTSFDEVVERVVRHNEDFPSAWVQGRGWDQNDWEVKEFPTKDKLDAAFPDIPVVLRRVDGHALIANTEAMKRAGVTSKSYVSGGEVILKNGEPSGVFVDNAMRLISSVVPAPGLDELVQALLIAQKNCFAEGLTTVTDAGVSKEIVLLFEDLQNSGDLKIRIYAMLNPNDENFDYFFPKGPIKTEKLAVSSVKLYVDGALGSRGALLLKPYTDAPEKIGLQMNDEAYYNEICKRAFDAGFQINTHAIGDSGNRMMLKTYAKYLKGKNDRRWRVEHAQVVNPADLSFFKDYSIIPSVQSTHCTSDMYWADERLGEDRIAHAYAYQDLLDQNGWLVNGTDFPVEGISPLKTFYAAVARQDVEGWPEDGFQMENALSREDALKSITIWPAKGSFEESFKGSIEAGKVADFVILEKDILQIDKKEIPDVKVYATFLDGEKVFSGK